MTARERYFLALKERLRVVETVLPERVIRAVRAPFFGPFWPETVWRSTLGEKTLDFAPACLV